MLLARADAASAPAHRVERSALEQWEQLIKRTAKPSRRIAALHECPPNTGDKTVWKDRLPIVESRVSEACTAAPEPHTKGAGHGEGYHLRRNGRAQGCHQAGGAAAGRDEACGVATGEREGGGAADGEEGAAAGAGGGALLLRSGSLRLRAAAMDPGGLGGLLGDRTVSDPPQAGRAEQDRSS